MTVFVLGGGPAGLAVVDGLVDSGIDTFKVIERGRRLGGLAQTIDWDGVGAHDLGPHKIFTLDDGLMRRVAALLPERDWLTRDKVSRIYMKGHYLPYPPSPFSLIGVFGLPAFTRMVAGYGLARLSAPFSSLNPLSFEQDLAARLGKPLYEVLFKPIAMKLWGNPAGLDVKLSQGRIQTPSILEVLGRMLKLKTSSEFEALTFRYPKGGLSRLWQAIEAKARGRGEFHLDHPVTGLKLAGDNIRAITVQPDANGAERTIEVGEDDFVASTLPLGLTVEFLAGALPPDIVRLTRETIVLNNLLLVFVHIDKPQLMPESWVFVPDPDISFHRVSEQESFDPGMTPRGSVVCLEVMDSDMRRMGAMSDQELTQVAIADLRSMGQRDFKVLASKVIRLPRSYPVYRVGYEAALARIMATLDGIRNFRSVGRQGSFNYIGTLDAMDIGYGFARWYAERGRSSWEGERARTIHYPVLD
jgi:protoporphyrinogen oxidase